MRRENGFIVLDEEKRLYEGFQGVVAIIDPNTIDKKEKIIYLKEVQFEQRIIGYKAKTIDRIVVKNALSHKSLKRKIFSVLETHPEVVKMGFPELAVNSDLSNLLNC